MSSQATIGASMPARCSACCSGARSSSRAKAAMAVTSAIFIAALSPKNGVRVLFTCVEKHSDPVFLGLELLGDARHPARVHRRRRVQAVVDHLVAAALGAGQAGDVDP